MFYGVVFVLLTSSRLIFPTVTAQAVEILVSHLSSAILPAIIRPLLLIIRPSCLSSDWSISTGSFPHKSRQCVALVSSPFTIKKRRQPCLPAPTVMSSSPPEDYSEGTGAHT